MFRTKTMVSALAALCCAPLVAAQSTPPDKDKMDKKSDMKGETVMVTGCVADGSQAGHYMLTNAMTSGGAMAKPGSTTSSNDGAMGMTVDLMGGDLTAHVGHKVEVTGMRGSMKKGAVDKNKSMDKNKTMSGSANMAHETLTVKSVKMISLTCP